MKNVPSNFRVDFGDCSWPVPKDFPKNTRE